MKTRHPAVVVLQALLDGEPIKLPDGYTLEAGEDDFVGIRMTKTDTKTGQPEEMIFDYPMSLNDFIKFCKGLTFDQVFLIGAQAALRDMNKERISNENKISP